MGKFNYIQNSFRKGELGPKLHTRGNSAEYAEGAALIENFIPSQEGGLFRRPGTKFFYDQRVDSRLIPFIVDKETAFIVSIVDANLIQNVVTIYNVNALNYDDYGYYVNPVITPTVPTEADTIKTFPTNVDLTGYNYTQINDVMIIAHTSGTVPTLCLVRTGALTFSIFRYFSDTITSLGAGIASPFALRSAFMSTNISSITLDIDTGTVGTGRGCVASQPIFDATKDIGRRVRIKQGTTIGTFIITAVTNATTVVITNESVCPTTATTDWAFSYMTITPSAASAEALSVEYPLTVSYFQQRLVFGGTRYNPDAVMLSFQNNIFNFSPADIATIVYGYAVTASVRDPIVAIPGVNQANKIQWLASSSRLEVGTLSTEFVCQIVEGSAVSNLSFDAQTSYGGSNVMSVRAGKSTLFISRDGKRIREFIFNDENGSFIGRDISVLNSEIIYDNFTTGSKFNTRIIQLAYQSSIDTVFAVTSLGALLGLTIDTQNNVASWHRHSIGSHTTSEVRSIAVVPSVTSDVLWMLVRRAVGLASLSYTIERMSSKFEYDTLVVTSGVEDDFPCFLDCAAIQDIANLPVFEIVSFASGTDKLTSREAHNMESFGEYVKVKYVAGTTAIPPLVDQEFYYIRPYASSYPNFTTVRLYLSIADVTSDTYIQITNTANCSGTNPYLQPVGFAAIFGLNQILVFGGKTYTALIDGIIHKAIPYVTGASVDRLIDGVNVYSQIIWGIPYTSTVKSLKYEAGGSFGTPEASIQRIHEIIVEFYNSYYAQYGRDTTTLLDFAGMDKVTKISSGIMAKFPGGSQRGDQVVITTSEPLPLTISSIVVKGVTYDG